MKIKAAIFDMDGTLVDSMDFVFITLNLVFKDLGLKGVNKERMNEIAGKRLSEILPYYAPQLSSEVLKNAELKFWSFYSAQRFHLIQGVEGTLKWLKKHGVNMGILTSTPREQVKNLLKKLGIDTYFKVIVANEDVACQKPNPDGVIKAADALGIKPQECIVVGDSINDIKAGKNAGAKTIGVLTGYCTKETFEMIEPDLVLNNVKDIPNTFKCQLLELDSKCKYKCNGISSLYN